MSKVNAGTKTKFHSSLISLTFWSGWRPALSILHGIVHRWCEHWIHHDLKDGQWASVQVLLQGSGTVVARIDFVISASSTSLLVPVEARRIEQWLAKPSLEAPASWVTAWSRRWHALECMAAIRPLSTFVCVCANEPWKEAVWVTIVSYWCIGLYSPLCLRRLCGPSGRNSRDRAKLSSYHLISNRHMYCTCFANIFLQEPSGVHFAKHLACKQYATPHIAQRKLQEDLPLEDHLTCDFKCAVAGSESKRPVNTNKCSSQSIYFMKHLIRARGDAVGRGDPK